MEIIFTIAILLMSVVIHEVAHGYAALWQGDVTAKYAGRLTLNPIKHLDIFGSIIVPGILAILPGGIIFGWAKPVPYNPYNLRNQRWGELFVAIAGPISNILIAIIFALIIRFLGPEILGQASFELSYYVVLINMVLAFFNLLPIPPLDGSKILFSILNQETANNIRISLERFGFVILLFFIFFIWPLFSSLIFAATNFLVGI